MRNEENTTERLVMHWCARVGRAEALDELGLKPGSAATAVFKTSSVILGVPA